MSDTDARLAASLRSSLAAQEPTITPPFAQVWSRAQRQAASGARAPTPLLWTRVVIAATAVAVVVWLGVVVADRQRAQQLTRAREFAADSALAQQLVTANERRVPGDALLHLDSSSLLRGGPELPAVEYPLTFKETLL